MEAQLIRRQIELRGLVQGVGLRPCVHRLALRYQLTGFVLNRLDRVLIEAQGEASQVTDFVAALRQDLPKNARIDHFKSVAVPPVATCNAFTVRLESSVGGEAVHKDLPSFNVPPDRGLCSGCRAEFFDSENRRAGYVWISCCDCGPRYGVIQRLPYERANTSFHAFALCDLCAKEFNDPNDRRYHHQGICCPDCGPTLSGTGTGTGTGDGIAAVDGNGAVEQAQALLRQGAVIAVKAGSGALLLCRGDRAQSVARLREIKQRQAKPLALLFASESALEALCCPTREERRLLQSAVAPIVLVKRRPSATQAIASNVAPQRNRLGVMLPSHGILLALSAHLPSPLVVSSANLRGEPIGFENEAMVAQFAPLCDAVFTHDLEIYQPADDSVMQVVRAQPQVLRFGRGLAPGFFQWPEPWFNRQSPVLALGGHLKNSVALQAGGQILLSQLIADLTSEAGFKRQALIQQRLLGLVNVNVTAVVVDSHPQYGTQRILAESLGSGSGSSLDAGLISGKEPKQAQAVQHHRAHVGSVLVEWLARGTPGFSLEASVSSAPVFNTPVSKGRDCPPWRALCLSWDGIGLGADEELWGGEFYLLKGACLQRLATFQGFQLPGAEQAVKAPYRVALSVLRQTFPSWQAEALLSLLQPLDDGVTRVEEVIVLNQMMAKGLNSPLCRSVGRLFDAAASVVGLCAVNRFEGEAAWRLQEAAESYAGDGEALRPYPGRWVEEKRNDGGCQAVSNQGGQDGQNSVVQRPLLRAFDWRPMFAQLVADKVAGVAVSEMAYRFHLTLVSCVLFQVRATGVKCVLASGGCFQNPLLVELLEQSLQAEGVTLIWPQAMPTNDSGLAAGQLMATVLGSD